MCVYIYIYTRVCVCAFSPEPSGWAWRDYHNCSFFSLGLSSPLAVGKTPRDGDGEREWERERECVCVCLRLHVNNYTNHQLYTIGFSWIFHYKATILGIPQPFLGKLHMRPRRVLGNLARPGCSVCGPIAGSHFNGEIPYLHHGFS